MKKFIIYQKWSGKEREKLATAETYADAKFITRALNSMYADHAEGLYFFESEE